MGSERPRPRRGDWIETKGAAPRIVLKFYSAPPGQGGGDELDAPRVGPNQYLGPVHDVDDSKYIVSVLLPHPTTGELAWLNIWSARRRAHDAFIVPDWRLAAWLRQGYNNDYQDSRAKGSHAVDDLA